MNAEIHEAWVKRVFPMLYRSAQSMRQEQKEAYFKKVYEDWNEAENPGRINRC